MPQVDSGQAVLLHFDYLVTEEKFDFVYVFDTDGRPLRNFTGRIDPIQLQIKPIVSSGSLMRVQLVSDAGVGARGFQAWFESHMCLGGCGNGSCSNTTGECICDEGEESYALMPARVDWYRLLWD